MTKEDVLLKLNKISSLNPFGIEIITAIIKEDLKMEMLKSIQSKTNLGDINFKKGLVNLLENKILVWVPEKSHRKKALYYGELLLKFGIKQIVKSYTNDERQNQIYAKRLLNLRNQGYVDKNKIKHTDIVSSAWADKGKTYENPHYTPIKEEGVVMHTLYLVNATRGFKQRFMRQYNKNIKIATEHLYRKAMAKFVPHSSTK